jgi:NADPH:quinone reductase-like Zn-dependent oxidoreductase
MKAVLFSRYGSIDALQLDDVEKPHPNDDEVLIKINAASINSWDWELLQGKPFWNRLIFGLLKPTKINILGCDVAGQIEAVGRHVTHLAPGDRVFGDLSGETWGGFAEYVCAPTNALCIMPKCMSYEHAAALPQASLLALQGLLSKDKLKPGQKVLVNGGGGGVGSYALQLAKYFGAYVTGVDCASKLNTMRLMGADEVIDYSQQDFTKKGQQYDLILDIAAYHSIRDYKRALKPLGHYIMVGGSSSLANRLMLFGWLISTLSDKNFSILLHKPNQGIEIIKTLYEEDKLVVLIDKIYPLQSVAKALAYFSKAQVNGKIVISIGSDSEAKGI